MPQITKLCLHIFCYAEKTVVVLFFSGHGVEYRSLYRTLDALCILLMLITIKGRPVTFELIALLASSFYVRTAYVHPSIHLYLFEKAAYNRA